jgi:hypothetical protein
MYDAACPAGFEDTPGNGFDTLCIPCPANKYKTLATNGQVCIDCPVNKQSPPGSKFIENCTCIAGWTGEPGLTACTNCPVGATSEPGMLYSSDCKCAPGYVGPNPNSCTVCPVNKYKSGLGDGVCQSCPGPTTSPSGSGMITKCSCTDGFYFDSVSQACLVCNANSHNNAGNLSSLCACNAGFTGPDGSPCTFCAAGTFKNFSGSASCIACSMVDGSFAPSTDDRKACATCSSFGAFGIQSAYPPKIDTSRLQVLARLSTPTIDGIKCVTGDNSTLSMNNDLDLGERLEIEYNCMVHDYTGFGIIAAHRQENMLFAASIPMDKIFAISTDRKKSHIYRLTGGIHGTINKKTHGIGNWINSVDSPVVGFAGNMMIDGLRNNARFMNIRNILVSPVHHVLWVFDYTTIRAVDIRGTRDSITWGNVFYICGSQNIATPTGLKTGDCVKNSGAQFLTTSGQEPTWYTYSKFHAPMAESADGMYLYISTGLHSIGRITLTRNVDTTKRSHSLPEYVAGVEVNSFLGNCPSAIGEICGQGDFVEISGNLDTYTQCNYVCTETDNGVTCSNRRGDALGQNIQSMAIAGDKMYVVAEVAIYMIDVNHTKTSYGKFYRVVSSLNDISVKLDIKDWASLSFLQSKIVASDSNNTLYISMEKMTGNSYAGRVLEWHDPGITGNKLEEVKVSASYMSSVYTANNGIRPNYVLAPYAPVNYESLMGGLSFARSKLFFTTVTVSLNAAAYYSLVIEAPVKGCWDCGQTKQMITNDVEIWHQQCGNLGGVLSEHALTKSNYICCNVTSPNCTLDVLTSLSSLTPLSNTMRCQRRTNTSITGAGSGGYKLPCVMEEAYRTLDSGTCVPCPTGMFRKHGESACTPPTCPAGMVFLDANSKSIDSCVCQHGSILNYNTGLCDECPPGTFNNRANESECFACVTVC